MYDEEEDGLGILEIIFGGIIVYAIFKMIAAFFRVFAEILIWFFSAWRYEVVKNADGSAASTWQEFKHLSKINWAPLSFMVLVLGVYNLNTLSDFKTQIINGVNPVQLVEAKTEIATVTARSLKVRATASAQSKVIDGLKLDEKVEVLTSQNGWTMINRDGVKGWVASRYLN